MVNVFLDNTRELVRQRLGLCPKCMASSIAGTFASWTLVAALCALFPDRIAITAAVVLASAFTILMLAHWFVHMYRVSGWLRDLSSRRDAENPTGPNPLRSRREFTFLVARSGAAFAAVSLGVLSPIRADAAKSGTTSGTTCTYCLGGGCNGGTSTGIPPGCGSAGFSYGSHVWIKVRGACPTLLTCTKGSCVNSPAELIGPGANGIQLKGWTCV